MRHQALGISRTILSERCVLCDDLEQHRQLVIAQVYKAFEGVSREGGVSWSESKAIDCHQAEETQREARSKDTDRSWTELVDSPNWHPDPGVGGFIFLDAIGCRYYLPPAMIRCIRVKAGHEDSPLMYRLEEPNGRHAGEHKRWLEHWSLLNEIQRDCVADFLRFMISSCQRAELDDWAEPWQAALDSYWHQFG